MKFKIEDIKLVLEKICKTYSVTAESPTDITLQQDNPGEGKFCDLLTFRVESADGSSTLVVEVYGATENRAPTCVFTQKLKKEEKRY